MTLIATLILRSIVMIIKKVTNSIFDIFWKDGWDNCIRIKSTGNKEYRIIKAYKKPPRDVFQFIKGAVK